jgi:hypothetical protein
MGEQTMDELGPRGDRPPHCAADKGDDVHVTAWQRLLRHLPCSVTWPAFTCWLAGNKDARLAGCPQTRAFSVGVLA